MYDVYLIVAHYLPKGCYKLEVEVARDWLGQVAHTCIFKHLLEQGPPWCYHHHLLAGIFESNSQVGYRVGSTGIVALVCGDQDIQLFILPVGSCLDKDALVLSTT